MADQERFARAVQSIARGLAKVGRERARVGDVTPQQAETLQIISERGAVSTSSLATLLGIDPSTASRNLSGLERGGFVVRKKGSDDGRQTDVRLTPRGKRIADAMSSETAQAYTQLLERVSKAERGRIIEAFEQVARLLDPT